MTIQEEKEDAYELRDQLVAYVDEHAPYDDPKDLLAAALGFAIEMGERHGMSEIQVAELLLDAALYGLPMHEAIAYREAHGYQE